LNIAITGEMGAGKSEVVAALKKDGFKVFSSDQVVSDLYKKNWFCKKVEEIIREKLSEETKETAKKEIVKNSIKQNPLLLNQLEELIHPYVKKYFALLQKKHINVDLVFFEVPLLFEASMEKMFDKVIFIKAPKEKRYERIKKTRNFDKEILDMLERRFINRLQKEKNSDFVIENDYSLESLYVNVKNIIDDLIRELKNE
jgi:dephospho-CoA kinase